MRKTAYKTVEGFAKAVRDIALGKRANQRLFGPLNLRSMGTRISIGSKNRNVGFYFAPAPYVIGVARYGAGADLNVSAHWVQPLTDEEAKTAKKLLNLLTPDEYEFEYRQKTRVSYCNQGTRCQRSQLYYRTKSRRTKWRMVHAHPGPCVIFPYNGHKKAIWTHT